MNGGSGQHRHCHFALSPAVKFAKEDSLPPAQQQLSIRERYGHRGPSQDCFDMRIGILLTMTKAHTVLRNQCSQSMKHVAWDIWVGIFVYCETCRCVLDIKHDDADTCS